MIDVGLGKRPRGTIARLLAASDNLDTSTVAPAHALSLRAVRYPAASYLPGES
jgi:tRNA pseudouridine38-40 synthase